MQFEIILSTEEFILANVAGIITAGILTIRYYLKLRWGGSSG